MLLGGVVVDAPILDDGPGMGQTMRCASFLRSRPDSIVQTMTLERFSDQPAKLATAASARLLGARRVAILEERKQIPKETRCQDGKRIH